MQMTFENRTGPFGYPVLNGQGIEPALIKVYPVKPGDEVVLASDGYPVLKETLADSEKALQEILAEDPLCFRACHRAGGRAVDPLPAEPRGTGRSSASAAGIYHPRLRPAGESLCPSRCRLLPMNPVSDLPALNL